MLAQFKARYPTSSLISELLAIYQGKFVVRVSAQVEGVTRATGMAAAETPELAEDRARSRALEVMAIDHPTSERIDNTDIVPESPIAVKVVSSEQIKQKQPMPFDNIDQFNALIPADSVASALPVKESTPTPNISAEVKGQPESPLESSVRTRTPEAGFPSLDFATLRKSDTYEQNPGQGFNLNSATADQQRTDFKDFGAASSAQTESSGEAPTAMSNVTRLTPRSHNFEASSSSQTVSEISEPVDLSDAIAQTDVELARLKWSKQYGRDYLIRTYSKRSRQQLDQEELLEFLDYLKSQPSP